MGVPQFLLAFKDHYIANNQVLGTVVSSHHFSFSQQPYKVGTVGISISR